MKKLSLVITPFVIAGFVLFAAAANAKVQPGTNIGDVTDTAAADLACHRTAKPRAFFAERSIDKPNGDKA